MSSLPVFEQSHWYFFVFVLSTHAPPFMQTQGSRTSFPPVFGLVLLTQMTVLDGAVVSGLQTGGLRPRDMH